MLFLCANLTRFRGVFCLQTCQRHRWHTVLVLFTFPWISLRLSDGKYFYTGALAVHGFSGELLFQSTITCKSSYLQPDISEERSLFSRVYEARLMAEGCNCYKVRFLVEDNNFISPHKQSNWYWFKSAKHFLDVLWLLASGWVNMHAAH